MTTHTTKVRFWGGPLDGGEEQMVLPLEPRYEHPGHVFADPEVGAEDEERMCQLMYRYDLHLEVQATPFGRRLRQYRYVFDHDWIDTEEGGEQMGFKKFGVGEITETETEKEDLSKTASQGWTDQDEQDLADEDRE